MLRQAPTLLTLTIDDVRRFQEASQASVAQSHTDDELCEGEREVLAWFSEPDSLASQTRSEQRSWIAVNKRHLQNSGALVLLCGLTQYFLSFYHSFSRVKKENECGCERYECRESRFVCGKWSTRICPRILGVRASASSTSLLNPSHASLSSQATDISNSTARRSTRAAVAGRFRGGGPDAAPR
ncbi:hypothetical protein BJ741DRAFT_615151 [Chytriomyces cf. hyalinus JEL632]|nr:hypothetical protein BJ741DRAFT_615151 [Chytriomyces cf. hyalinus JEL632]